MLCTCATRRHSVIWPIRSRGCKSRPVRDRACKSRLDMKEELGLMPALRGRILVKGSQSRTAWIHSSGEKDTQDGTDKCFVRWMEPKTRYLADIIFHITALMFISLFRRVSLRYWQLLPLPSLLCGCVCVTCGATAPEH